MSDRARWKEFRRCWLVAAAKYGGLRLAGCRSAGTENGPGLAPDLRRTRSGGFLAAAAAFGLVHASGGPLLGAALAGAWAEDVAFVGYFAVRAVREQSRHHKHRQGVTYFLFTAWSAFWSLFIELGLAETVDKLVRPALLYEIPRSLHNLIAGFIVAKLSADVIYYLLAYGGRRVRIRYLDPGA